MADNSMENAMESEPPDDDPTTEEYHDAITANTGENPTLTGAEWKEIHLLLEITYQNHPQRPEHYPRSICSFSKHSARRSTILS
jgi:hypothetical protein